MDEDGDRDEACCSRVPQSNWTGKKMSARDGRRRLRPTRSLLSSTSGRWCARTHTTQSRSHSSQLLLYSVALSHLRRVASAAGIQRPITLRQHFWWVTSASSSSVRASSLFPFNPRVALPFAILVVSWSCVLHRDTPLRS